MDFPVIISTIVATIIIWFAGRYIAKLSIKEERTIDNMVDPGNCHTINGVGTTMKDANSFDDEFVISYRFIVFFFLPILPINCYLIKYSQTDSNRWSVYGSLNWKYNEIIGIYLKWWALPIGFVSSVFMFGY